MLCRDPFGKRFLVSAVLILAADNGDDRENWQVLS